MSSDDLRRYVLGFSFVNRIENVISPLFFLFIVEAFILIWCVFFCNGVCVCLIREGCNVI